MSTVLNTQSNINLLRDILNYTLEDEYLFHLLNTSVSLEEAIEKGLTTTTTNNSSNHSHNTSNNSHNSSNSSRNSTNHSLNSSNHSHNASTHAANHHPITANHHSNTAGHHSTTASHHSTTASHHSSTAYNNAPLPSSFTNDNYQFQEILSQSQISRNLQEELDRQYAKELENQYKSNNNILKTLQEDLDRQYAKELENQFKNNSRNNYYQSQNRYPLTPTRDTEQNPSSEEESSVESFSDEEEDSESEETGLSKKNLEQYPCFKYESQVQMDCTICMDSYNRGDDLRRLSCLHYFHRVCIDKWLSSSRRCPICNYKL